MSDSVFQLTFSSLDQWIASIRSLPLGVHAPAIVALVGGLVLWSAGGKVLKPISVLLGACAGALLGGILLPIFIPERVGSVPSPYVGLGAGAFVGALIAVSLFRFAMMWAGGIALGLAGVLGASVYLSHTTGLDLRGLSARQEDKNPAFREQLDSIRTELSDAGKAVISNFKDRRDKGEGLHLGREFSEAGSTLAATRTREFVTTAGDDAKAVWNDLPGQSKLIVATAGLASAISGVLLGLFAPKSAASAVTAMLGAAVVLFSTVWLLRALDVQGSWLEQSPTGWLVIGGVLAAVGMGIQSRRSAKNPAPAPLGDARPA
jgi:hypothetical protein